MIGSGILESLYMTALATLFGYVLGLPWGVMLSVTGKEGIHPKAAIYRTLDLVANILSEYYGAAEPPFRCGVSRLSGTG